MNAHASTGLLPDREALATFVGAMFRHADEDTFISLRAFEDGGRDAPSLFVDGVRVDDPALIERIFVRANQAAQHVNKAVFCPPVATFSNTRKATKDDLANGVVLTVECDRQSVIARRTLSEILGEPTLVCASGGEWINPETGEVEDKLHLHWRLTEPTRDAVDHKKLELARQLACAFVGADATCVPLNHPLRWPGSVHRKKTARLSRIVSQTENEIDLTEALDLLQTACPEARPGKSDFARAMDQGRQHTSLKGEPLDIAAALAAIPNHDLDWEAWNKIGMATWKASDGKAFASFDAWSQQSAKYDPSATASRWAHYSISPPDKIGAGTLFFYAAAAIPGWTKPSAHARGSKSDDDSGDSRADSAGPEGSGGWGDSGAGARASDSTGAQQGRQWPEPKHLPSGLLPVMAFDSDTIPASIGPWINDISDRMQCPPDFVATPAIIGLAAVLGRKIAVRPQEMTDWTEVPNLWGCIVGRPGAMKSPAMSEALKPLNRLEAEARKQNERDAIHNARLFEAFKIKKDEAAKAARVAAKAGATPGEIATMLDIGEPERLTPRRYVANDVTYEKLGEILVDNPNGVLAFRDELMSLLKTFDREENVAARGFFLTAWNGKDGYSFDRIIRGSTHIEAVCVSLLGSTQPGRLAEYLTKAIKGGAGDDGLVQRFSLLVWPDDNGQWREVDRYPESEPRRIAWETFSRLDQITPASIGAIREEFSRLPYLRLDDAARDAFGEWRRDLEMRLRTGGMHTSLESHLSKYRKLVPSLALINHLADGGHGPVTEIAMLKALAFSQYLESHARRAYGSGLQAEAATGRLLLERIKKGDLTGEFTVRDVQRHDWSNLSDKDQITAGLELLDDLGWVVSRKIDTGGRPKTVFVVNPRGMQ